eukprot:CAMPEP_0203770058 /NCGR_PEP_ID=MMETSP0099_2-20121227/2567_1 /ASSEMBLY_ACC=CAM_ASM_000209 /TAXON_ID=96639 /ORGANISM=" , Strain NY0313808BC1" /LENGTH=281 /DNA_ID=CAMNT_0050667087 /DNA_START=82 /DNA_END=927 /DNA_ORIENTATION=+
MFIGKQKTPLSVLEKKVPRNPKYKNVRGNLDTGSSMSKVKVISTKEFLRRQNEIFTRIKPRDLAEALELDPFSKDASEEKREGKSEDSQRPETSGSSLLLLDLRELSDYRTCHIKTAVSYPIVNINQDRFTMDMYRFKNKQGKIIVVYDDDERTASNGATVLVERGFENVRLLSGGLTIFGNMLGHLLEGELPEHLVKKKTISPTGSTATRRSERRRRRHDGASSPRESYPGSVSGFSTTSSVVSHRSTFSRAPRWKSDASTTQQHKEILARMQHKSYTNQ